MYRETNDDFSLRTACFFFFFFVIVDVFIARHRNRITDIILLFIIVIIGTLFIMLCADVTTVILRPDTTAGVIGCGRTVEYVGHVITNYPRAGKRKSRGFLRARGAGWRGESGRTAANPFRRGWCYIVLEPRARRIINDSRTVYARWYCICVRRERVDRRIRRGNARRTLTENFGGQKKYYL